MVLYIILCDKWLRGRRLEEIALRIARSGVSMIQLREDKEAREIIKDAREIKAVFQNFDVIFLINNRPDIALEVNAHGVHIGQSDVSITTARKIIGQDKLIGVSVHSVREALFAQENGADYISFGSIYPSKTKLSKVRQQSIMVDIRRSVNLPLFAIGGITLENVDPIIRQNINGVCVSRDVIDRDDIEDRVKAYLKLLKAPDKSQYGQVNQWFGKLKN